MRDKYDSTDFWYKFLNSLNNFGLASGRGKLEMDEEMQDKVLFDGDGWDGPLAQQFGIGFGRFHPAFVLIGKDGKVLMSRYGQIHSRESWCAKLEELLTKHL